MVVAIAGYYGYKNAGDEAMLHSLVREAKARGHQPIVLTASPEETARELEVEAVHRYDLLELTKAIARADLFLLGGGGLFQDRTSYRSLLYYLALIRLARFFKKPRVVCGVSLGPLSPRGERAVRRYLKGATLVVRDRTSLAYARSLGLRAELGGDPALLLEPPEIPREPGLVLFIPRYGVRLHAMISVAHKLAKEGRDVFALALQPGKDDKVLELFKGVPQEATGDPKRALYLIRSAEYVISARLHGMVLAAAAGTPFAGVDYDPKVRGFARDAGAHLLPERPSAEAILRVLVERPEPNWNAILEMKRRVRATLDRVLPAPTPANGV